MHSISQPQRVALVTGAGTRIGRAIALDLHAHGWRVAAHYLRHTPSKRFIGLRADLSLPDEPAALAAAFRTRFERLDLLVCNAAIFGQRSLSRTDAAFFDQQMAVNARAPLLLARAFAPMLRRARGSIVTIADIGGALVPWAGFTAYGASKAALRAITEALALELAPQVRVNAIAPGAILWPESYPASLKRTLTSRIPLRRVGNPDDISQAVRYLAEASFVTGALLTVDGGRHLSGRH